VGRLLKDIGDEEVRKFVDTALSQIELKTIPAKNPYYVENNHTVPHGIVDAPGAAKELRGLIRERGRRPLTIEAVDQICEVLREGNHLDTALSVAGVMRADWRDWMKKADRAQDKEDEKGEHANLSETQQLCLYAKEETFKASKCAERQLVSLVSDAALEDWRAAAWMLARRFPKSWGSARETHKPTSINIGVSPGVMLLQAPSATALDWQGSIPTIAEVLQNTNLIDVEVLGSEVETTEDEEGGSERVQSFSE
jgi:hypothetical protein